MNTEQFVYWLQGMLEYTDVNSLTEEDLKTKLQGIKDHLKLVFNKVTPEAPVKQKSLNDLSKEISDGIKQGERKTPSEDERRFQDIVDNIKNSRPELPYIFPRIDPATWPKIPGYEIPYMPPFQSPYTMQTMDIGYGKGPIC